MAGELNTAASVVDGIGGVAGLIPGYGTAIAGVASLISGGLKMGAAAEQKKRAEDLRSQSKNLPKMPLRPEYLKALRTSEMSSLYGIPGLEGYTNKIDADVANNARAIVESSPDGGVALNAINATLNKGYQAKNDLYLKDALMKQDKQEKTNNMLWNTGDKQMDLVGLQREDKKMLNSAAGNLENAATANKQGSLDQILSSVALGTSGLVNGVGGGGTSAKVGGNSLSNNTSLSSGANAMLNDKSVTPSVLSSAGSNSLPNVQLSQQEQFALINQLINTGQAANQTEALGVLRNKYGYNF